MLHNRNGLPHTQRCRGRPARAMSQHVVGRATPPASGGAYNGSAGDCVIWRDYDGATSSQLSALVGPAIHTACCERDVLTG
jgi:hypothetical protein